MSGRHVQPYRHMDRPSRCECCGTEFPSIRELTGQMLLRVMPRRIPNKWDAQDLADEAIAVLASVGWLNETVSPAPHPTTTGEQT